MSDTNEADDPLNSAPAPWDELQTALGEGDPDRVRALIAAGADIRYKRHHGYDALLDALTGRDVAGDPRLLDLLSLLISHGVDLSGETSYRESGLRRLSNIGRFDAVRLLLDAGADRCHLGWTKLHEAVALGALADVEAVIAAGEPLEERDWWSRTTWHIALRIGDRAKAEVLRARGADPNARGHCGHPPLYYAVKGRRPDLVRWLLQNGADVHQKDEFGSTALIESVRVDDLECVDILLAAGADIAVNANGTPLSYAHSRDTILRLLDAGADPADLPGESQRIVLGLPDAGAAPLAAVSAEEFRSASTRVFGRSNPERMRIPFWEAMVRAGISGYGAARRFDSAGAAAGPVWCADRFGQSLTLLSDGRAIQIAGEHEDSYDPDFCIYNDVFVHGPDGEIAIFGYPEAVFPPTDFHTATPIDDGIYVIGSLGYSGTRRYGETPVYRLDVVTLRMDRLDVAGDAPGWICKHRATAIGREAIRVRGGTVVTRNGERESHDPNTASHVLDLKRLQWRRETG